jgi:hypothetical protein
VDEIVNKNEAKLGGFEVIFSVLAADARKDDTVRRPVSTAHSHGEYGDVYVEAGLADIPVHEHLHFSPVSGINLPDPRK